MQSNLIQEVQNGQRQIFKNVSDGEMKKVLATVFPQDEITSVQGNYFFRWDRLPEKYNYRNTPLPGIAISMASELL